MKQLLFITVFFFPFINIFAQTDTLNTVLSEITISANKYETSLFNTASSVTIITAKDIEKKQSSSVVELLRGIPGISLTQQGGTGKLSSVFIRGANSNFVLAMIDDVEINDPSSSNSAFDFSSLQVSDIERIEIVRGPQSTLYGSEATAGIINIITKSGKGKPTFSVQAEAGSNSYYKGSFSAGGEESGVNYLINFSRLNTESVSSIRGNNFENDGYSNNSGTIKLGYNISDKINVSALYKYTGTKTDLDQAEKNGDDSNFISKLESHLVSGKVEGSFLNDKWESLLKASYFRTRTTTLDNVDASHPETSSNSNYYGKRYSINWQNNLKLFDNHLFTVGVDRKTDEANSTFHSVSMFGPFDSNFPNKDISTTGIYIQDLIHYGNLTATLGYRFDNNDEFGSVSTYRIAPMYFIEKTNTKLKATFGTGFKAPSLFNLYAPFYGNENLKPEKSKGWDAGIEQFLFNNKVALGLTYFKIEFEDMLGFDENFKSLNVNKAETKGIEATVSIENISGVSLDAGYTYNESNDLSVPGISKQQLIRRPKNQFNFDINYVYNELNLGVSVRHSGEKFDNDFSTFPSERVALKAYTVANVKASYKFFDYLKLYGRVENIFNEKYEDILYYGTLDRSGYIGFEINL